ncbi:MAG: helix-turn-helix transcriptional regulator [Halobacteriovoraceae bacterium]|nr:helix-turn-helix transcriptional regulator [Halobacteriovoraceae bacterium]
MLFKELRELNVLSVEEAAEILGVTAKTIYRWENGEIEPRKAFLRLLEEQGSQKIKVVRYLRLNC